jgi:hypothetical protein
MKRVDLFIHGVIALAWVGLTLGISLKIALLGNESAAIAKQRGADFKTRTELMYKQERLRVTFEKESSVPALEQLVRTLNLPIQPPVMTAFVLSPRP